MVAFSFKSRFVSKIEDPSKRQTIRNMRKRNSWKGDVLQLFTGPRFKPVRLGAAACVDCGPIGMDFKLERVSILWVSGNNSYYHATSLDDFAVDDGFEDWDDLRAFWRETHDVQLFEGWATHWGDTFCKVGVE
jgi:hypothetical protein